MLDHVMLACHGWIVVRSKVFDEAEIRIVRKMYGAGIAMQSLHPFA